MKKNTKYAIVSFLASIIYCYLMISFYNMSFNPVDFGEGGRLGFILISPLFGLLVSSYFLIVEKD